MKKQTKIALTMIVACLFLNGTISHAGDKKVYHAAFCKAANGVETDYSRSEYRITKTGGSDSAALLCPIDKDVFGCSGTFGCVKGMSVEISVFDVHDGDVSCTLSSRNSSGSAYWYSTDKTKYQPGRDTLRVNGAAQWGNFDSYILKCKMPKNTSGYPSRYTKIYSYHVYENN